MFTQRSEERTDRYMVISIGSHHRCRKSHLPTPFPCPERTCLHATGTRKHNSVLIYIERTTSFQPYPVARASSACNSLKVHSRAPPALQNASALAQARRSLHPPRLWSDSPQTLLLPNRASFVHLIDMRGLRCLVSDLCAQSLPRSYGYRLGQMNRERDMLSTPTYPNAAHDFTEMPVGGAEAASAQHLRP